MHTGREYPPPPRASGGFPVSAFRRVKLVLSLLALVCLAAAPFPLPGKGTLLTHCKGAFNEQTVYGERGCAVRFETPDPARSWYAVEVRVVGEAYGDVTGDTPFYITFMDEAGNAYGKSEHRCADYFSTTPTWAEVPLDPPVQVPAAFRVVVDFRPDRERGVFVGYVKGGGHSMIADEAYNLYEIKEDLDFSIEVRVVPSVKGGFTAYDPKNFVKRAKPKKEERGPAAKKTASDRVVIETLGLQDVWGPALLRICEGALDYYRDGFGLEPGGAVTLSVRVDPKAERVGLRRTGPGRLAWTLRKRADLLPRSRGGKETHLYNLCRLLLEDLLRTRLLRAKYAPKGVIEGFSAYLAPAAVEHLYRTYGRELWPVPFNYYQEEGPSLVEAWLQEEPATPEKKIAAVLAGMRKSLGDKRLAGVVKAVFRKPLPAREVMARLRGEIAPTGKEKTLAPLFTEEMLHPPVVWTVPQPALRDPAAFEGLEVRSFRGGVFMTYDRGRAAELLSLEDPEEEYLLWCTVPKGRWRVEAVKLFCTAPKGVREGRFRMRFLDGALEEFATVEAVSDRVPDKKAGWCSLGGAGEVLLSGPFFFSFAPDASGRAGIRVGVDRRGKGGHSAVLLPGSHVGAVPGGGDWMVRFHLAPEPPLDRKVLDDRVKTLRRRLKGAGGHR